MNPVAPNLRTTANMTRTTMAPNDNVGTRKRQLRHARVPAALRLAPVRAALATSLTCATIVAPIRAVDSHSIASAIVAAAEATLIAATAPHGAPLALARCRYVVLSVSVRCLRRALHAPLVLRLRRRDGHVVRSMRIRRRRVVQNRLRHLCVCVCVCACACVRVPVRAACESGRVVSHHPSAPIESEPLCAGLRSLQIHRRRFAHGLPLEQPNARTQRRDGRERRL